jgi:hypothetical protein
MVSQISQQNNENTDQTMNTIEQIDGQIQSMYINLEALNVQSNPDINKQNQLLQKIQELQQLKSSLYTSLSNNYASVQSNVALSRNSLVNEMAVSGLVKNELQNVQNNLSSLEDSRYNTVRMAEINNYYSEKYDTQTSVMKTIVYFCIPLLILGIVTKKELIPKKIALVIMSILIGLAIVIVSFQVIDIMRRDNMVFSEYRFPFNPDDVDKKAVVDLSSPDQPVARNLTQSCTGEACCPSGNTYGTIWDATNKQCVTPSYKDTQKEGFVGEKCLQNSFNKADFNVNVFKENNNTISGYSENNSNSNNYAKF